MLSRLRVVYALGGALMIALNVGCASAVPLVPLQGAPSDLVSLVGEWQGEYTSPTSGRSGLIWFTLIAGEDHAHGCDNDPTRPGAVLVLRAWPGTNAGSTSQSEAVSVDSVRSSI
jgi:hypothetical protein